MFKIKQEHRVLSKFGGLRDHSKKNLEELISSIQNIQRELNDAPEEHEITPTQSLILMQTIRKIKEAISRMGQEHKDLHSTVSKVGKSVDRNFVTDFTSISQECNFEEEEKRFLLNEVISEHFMRQGMLHIADALIEDAEVGTTPQASFLLPWDMP